jgi:ABC-type bacteriocin/lantibiotic exporter with double-glycine peptidase domain
MNLSNKQSLWWLLFGGIWNLVFGIIGLMSGSLTWLYIINIILSVALFIIAGMCFERCLDD